MPPITVKGKGSFLNLCLSANLLPTAKVQLLSMYLESMFQKLTILCTRLVKWDKIDKDGYKEMITRDMTKYIYNLDNRELSLHELIGNIFELLVNSAKKHSKQRRYGKIC